MTGRGQKDTYFMCTFLFKVVLEFLPKVTTLVLPSKLALTYK